MQKIISLTKINITNNPINLDDLARNIFGDVFHRKRFFSFVEKKFIYEKIFLSFFQRPKSKNS